MTSSIAREVSAASTEPRKRMSVLLVARLDLRVKMPCSSTYQSPILILIAGDMPWSPPARSARSMPELQALDL